jgi:hypothetical protein
MRTELATVFSSVVAHRSGFLAPAAARGDVGGTTANVAVLRKVEARKNELSGHINELEAKVIASKTMPRGDSALLYNTAAQLINAEPRMKNVGNLWYGLASIAKDIEAALHCFDSKSDEQLALLEVRATQELANHERQPSLAVSRASLVQRYAALDAELLEIQSDAGLVMMKIDEALSAWRQEIETLERAKASTPIIAPGSRPTLAPGKRGRATEPGRQTPASQPSAESTPTTSQPSPTAYVSDSLMARLNAGS